MHNFVDALTFIGNHVGLLWQLTREHLKLSGAAVLIAVLIGLPVGVWLGHLRRGSFLAINVSNIGRALPSLAVIAILLPIFGLGFVNNMVALIVLAVPPILTNAYVGIAQVDPDAVEAARGMGMRRLQVLTRVEMPLALPLIFAGLRTSVVYVIATATIASYAGGSSLGDIIFNQASYRLSGVIGAALLVALLAIVAELGFGGLQRAVTPKGLKEAAAGREAPATVGPAIGPVTETA